MSYKNAFNCKRCPKNATENGCPCWCEVIWTNVQTGEEKVVKDCLFRMLPAMMIEVIKASNRPAASVESMRNETIKNLDLGFQKVFTGLKALQQTITKKALKSPNDKK